MKELIDNIQKSIYGPDYYRAILAEPLRASLKYFVSFTLLLTVFLTIVSSIPLVANANAFMHAFPERFFAYFPDDLEVTITNGTVSSNVKEPYFLPIPTELKSTSPEKDALENVAVIDTATPFSMDQFMAYKSAIWLGRDQLAYRDNSGSVKIQQLGKTANYVLNERVLRGYESRIAPYYALIGPVIVLAIFFALCIGFGFNLLYLLVAALFIMLLLRIMKPEVTYKSAYQIGLHAITLPLLVDALFAMSSLAFMRVQFAPTIIMLMIVYVNFRHVAPVTPEAGLAPIPTEEKN